MNRRDLLKLAVVAPVVPGVLAKVDTERSWMVVIPRFGDLYFLDVEKSAHFNPHDRECYRALVGRGDADNNMIPFNLPFDKRLRLHISDGACVILAYRHIFHMPEEIERGTRKADDIRFSRYLAHDGTDYSIKW